MDVMELVENETNARPFQCDWNSCNKVYILSPFISSNESADIPLRVSIGSQIFKDIIEFTPTSALILA